MFENEVYPDVVRVLADLQKAGHRLLVAPAKPTIFSGRVLAHFELSRQ